MHVYRLRFTVLEGLSWTSPQWAEAWLAGRSHLQPKTLASYRSLLSTRVLPTCERVPLAKVRHSDVAARVAGMRAEGLSASRTRQVYHVLTSMLDAAVRDGRLARNPAAGVDLPRLPTTDRRYLTHAQLADLAEYCGRTSCSCWCSATPAAVG